MLVAEVLRNTTEPPVALKVPSSSKSVPLMRIASDSVVPASVFTVRLWKSLVPVPVSVVAEALSSEKVLPVLAVSVPSRSAVVPCMRKLVPLFNTRVPPVSTVRSFRFTSVVFVTVCPA